MASRATPTNPFGQWLAAGCKLAEQRREHEWALADWLAAGKEAGHLREVRFDRLGVDLGIITRRLKDALKAATTFPVGVREPSVSVEHHAAIANLPGDEAVELLKRAAAEKLTVQAMREAMTAHRYATGERWDDEDTDTTLATLQIRAWNRATPEARALAFEQFKIAAERGLTIVDEDEAVDA